MSAAAWVHWQRHIEFTEIIDAFCRNMSVIDEVQSHRPVIWSDVGLV